MFVIDAGISTRRMVQSPQKILCLILVTGLPLTELGMTIFSAHGPAHPASSQDSPLIYVKVRPPLSNAVAKRGDALELTITVPKMTAKRTAHLPASLFVETFLSLREATGRRIRETMTSYSLIYLTWGLRKHNNDHSYPFFDHCDIKIHGIVTFGFWAVSGTQVS